MHVTILQVLRTVYLRAETNVALFVSPHAHWLEVSPEHPLSNVELLPADDQRSLNILLHHPRDLLGDYVIEYLIQLVKSLNASPARHAGWFHYPNVVFVQGELRICLPESCVQDRSSLHQLVHLPII